MPSPLPNRPAATQGTLTTFALIRHAAGLFVLLAGLAIGPTVVRRATGRVPAPAAVGGRAVTVTGTTRSWASLLHQNRVRVGLDVAPELAARLREGSAATVTPLNSRQMRLGARVVRVADHVDVATQRVAVEVEVDDTLRVITRGAPVEVELP